MKLSVADMKRVVSLEDVLYVLEKNLTADTEYVTIDVESRAIALVEKMYEFAEER